MRTSLFGGLAVCAAALPASASVDCSANIVDNGNGTWTYNISLTNNIPNNYSAYLYFFGVDLNDDPSQFAANGWVDWGTGWSNAWGGGSNTIYNTCWIGGNLTQGNTESSFSVTESYLDTDISFYAFGISSPDYNGQDAFWKGWNPGFEGKVSVPAPGAAGLLALAGFAAGRRRR